eukprot:436737_1
MGIAKLLKELKPITEQVHLSKFSGQTCGVDISCWLHRGANSCALQLISGEPTAKYLDFALKCIQILQYHNITPIIVFDGAQLPMKANEEQRRNTRRKANQKKALQCAATGQTDLASKYAKGAITITSDMVTEAIKQCVERNIQYICAPYEADAQLAFLFRNEHIDFVITEDSDLLLYGVKKALYKFNPCTKTGDYVNMDKINDLSALNNSNDLCKLLNKYSNVYKQLLIHIGVLSGCDYVKNLKGIGIKTSIKYCSENRNIDHIVDELLSIKFSIAPNDYKEQFKQAVWTFHHQRVYNINTKKLTYLNPLTPQVKIYSERKLNGLHFLGSNIEDHIAESIADGRVDARSFKPRDFGVSIDSYVEMKESSDTENECVSKSLIPNNKTPIEQLKALGITTAELKFAVESNNIVLAEQRKVVHFTISQMWKQRSNWMTVMENVETDDKMILLIGNIAKCSKYLSSQ